MKTVFSNKFLNQIGAVRFKTIRKKVETAILDVEKSGSLSEIKNLKKLKGETKYFRIRIGDYRIGLYVENGIVEFTTMDHRKDIYKHFP
jgi:mRNA interferase RelE/StbE